MILWQRAGLFLFCGVADIGCPLLSPEDSMQVLAAMCQAPVPARMVFISPHLAVPAAVGDRTRWGMPCWCQSSAQGEGKLFLSLWSCPGHSWEGVQCCDSVCRKLHWEEAHGAAEHMAWKSQCWVSWHGGCNSSV